MSLPASTLPLRRFVGSGVGLRADRAALTNIDGYDGDTIDNVKSPNSGKLVKNGWQNSSAPWTYNLYATMVYHAESGY